MANENPKKAAGRRDLIVTVIALSLMVAVFGFLGRPLDRLKSPLLGQKAPNITFQFENGENASLEKKNGTVVLLNFWASWCGPCIEEMPSLQMLEAHFAKRGFQLLAFDIEDSPEEMKGSLDTKNFPHHLIYRFNKQALRPYDVNSIPLSVLIDREGIVRDVHLGPKDWMSMGSIRQIESLLN